MLKRDFYLRDANTVARDLLGKLLVHETPDGRMAGMIVETEAYIGSCDAASHAYKNRRSPRTEAQFFQGGHVYMYMIYGMYYCFNVVTNTVNIPEAVLVRALEPVTGIELMRKNRGKPADLCSGPGKLCQAMALDKRHYGYDLCEHPLFIEAGNAVSSDDIAASPRVNIDYAGEARDYLWRYFIKNNAYVSKVKRSFPKQI